MLYKENFSSHKGTHALFASKTYTFSLYILRSSNLTVGELFSWNSSGDRIHCFFAAARTLLVGWLKPPVTVEPPRVSILEFLPLTPQRSTPHIALPHSLIHQCMRIASSFMLHDLIGNVFTFRSLAVGNNSSVFKCNHSHRASLFACEGMVSYWSFLELINTYTE